MKRIIGALAVSVFAFTVAVLSTATPSAAASYTFNFTGTVTGSTGLFPLFGTENGDPVTGSMTFDPFNDSTVTPIPGATLFDQPATSFTFHTEHPGVSGFTRTDTGVAFVQTGVGPAISFSGSSHETNLDLVFSTDASGFTPLTSLAGLPTTTAGLIALLTGSPVVVAGTYVVVDFGSVDFDLAFSAVPIPATLPLFGATLAALGYIARRRKAARAA
jgi:hypothetical protein